MPKTKELTIKASVTIKLSPEDIDDIMVTALEGGIVGWCYKAEVVGERLGQYASEQISRGGMLKLYGSDKINGESKWLLTQEKFLAGVKQWMEEYGGNVSVMGAKLDVSEIDSDDADSIIQYALFGELVFG